MALDRCVLALVAIVAATAATALAGDVAPTLATVKRSASKGDAIAFGGILSAPRDMEVPTSLEFRCGTYAESVEAAKLVPVKHGLVYKAVKGTTGAIGKFSVSLKTGKFSLSAKGIDVGSLDAPLSFTIDVGGQRFTGLLPMKGNGASRSWKKGRPIQALLTGRVFRVGNALGNPVLTPVSGGTFVRDDAEEDVVVVAGSRTTDADGAFALTIEYTDAAALSHLDLGRVLGAESTLTRPGAVEVTLADGGTLETVAFVQPRSGAGGTISPGAPSSFAVTGADGAPSGALSAPAGAVTADAPGVTFTPYTMAVELPAPLPEGYVALAGAEVGAPSPVVFVAAQAPVVEISRPSWTEKGPLSTADIRLLQLRNGAWEEQPGRGIYDPLQDRFVPDFVAPAKLAEASPVVYAAKVVAAQAKALVGKVEDKNGAAVKGVAVLSRAGAMVSSKKGAFRVAKSTLASSSLEVVQVVGAGSATGQVVTAAAADAGEVTVQVAETAPPDWTVGVVLGTVYESGGTRPAAGASVTLAIAGAVRGLIHDDRGTPDNFADDRFAVPDLNSLGVTTYQWALSIPGQPDEFVSAQSTTNSVSPTLLMLEAQTAGRAIVDGAYTVRVGYTIPNLAPFNLFGGFRVTTEGIDLVVSDVQIPAGFEGTPSVTVTANAEGQYVKFYRAPPGIPMTATATSAAGTNTVTRSFFFDAFVTIDLSVDAPTPEGVPVGWSTRAPLLPSSAVEPGVGAVEGKAYLVGANGGYPSTTTIVAYDPVANAWTSELPPLRGRGGGVAVVSGGLVYDLGGGTNVRAYDPSSGTWSTRDAMSFTRANPAVAAVNGKILVVGGYDSSSGSVFRDDVEVYDTQLNSWSPAASLPAAGRRAAAAAAVDGVLYVIGGETELSNSSGAYGIADVWAYTAASDSWSPRAPMPVARRNAASAVIDGEIYVVGGSDQSQTYSTMYVYNPSTDTWRKGPGMPGARASHGAVAIGGVLYVIGGVDPDSGPSPSAVYAYRPK